MKHQLYKSKFTGRFSCVSGFFNPEVGALSKADTTHMTHTTPVTPVTKSHPLGTTEGWDGVEKRGVEKHRFFLVGVLSPCPYSPHKGKNSCQIVVDLIFIWPIP